jgi:hypothetical protein
MPDTIRLPIYDQTINVRFDKVRFDEPGAGGHIRFPAAGQVVDRDHPMTPS